MAEVGDKRALGRENLAVIEGIPEAERQQIWAEAKAKIDAHAIVMLKEEQSNPLGCHYWPGALPNGYPGISQGHGKSKIKIHMLAVYIARREIPGPSQVSSHLCHTKFCCNPDHIVIESIRKNSARNGCLHSLWDEKSGTTWCLCPHEPRCMQPDHSNLNGFRPFKL